MEKIDIVKLSDYNMRVYSEMANQMRAIPDARTGLKPIHTKILYEMWVDGISSKGKYNKCAKMVGQVISRFSEHGDSATYEALVRLAQPWIQRYPLLDFHGNAGSQFGDGPASMRYTESKLSRLVEDGFLSTLDKDPIEWKMNYTNEEREPTTLPAVFPGLFCLSNQGMGYGCACNFLTFNLGEVAQVIHDYVDGKGISTIYYDLPTGGTFVNPQEMPKIMATGKGSVVIESKYEETKSGLVFTEIPFNVMFDDVMDQIKGLYETGALAGVSDVRNDSGKDGIRLIIDVSKDTDKSKVLDLLFTKTSLRTSYAINQVALVDGWPELLSFEQMCEIYVNHNIECIKREHQFDLDKTKRRLEILEGLSKALEDIDNVVAIIKSSRDVPTAKKNLMGTLEITDVQAGAILEMRLSKLANLEKIAIDKELEEKAKLCLKLEKVIGSEKEQKKVLLKRLDALVKEFDTPRRTAIQEKQINKVGTKSLARSNVEYDQSLRAIGKVLSKDGAYCDDDFLLCLSNLGKVYRIKVEDVSPCKKGEPSVSIGALLNLSEDEHIIAVDPKVAVFVTSAGLVKKIDIQKEFSGTTRNKSGMQGLKLDSGSKIVGTYVDEGGNLALFTDSGFAIQFGLDEVPFQGKAGRGVIGIKLADNDFVASCDLNVADLAIQRRGGKGKKIR